MTTASIHTIQADLDKVVKPLLKEILEQLNDRNSIITEIVEAAAAKIISEMKHCDCNREILTILQKQPNTDIIERKENNPGKLYQYSYPNNSVGNEQLGTGKNPNSLSWPPKD